MKIKGKSQYIYNNCKVILFTADIFRDMLRSASGKYLIVKRI
ncbi:hypothetical protein HMPREF2738_03426 [Clostridiales bacterium KLE1615]|nr:hypothetical protein HMPREF2738_03426 [Clostridiales bacterium KLE1615]